MSSMVRLSDRFINLAHVQAIEFYKNREGILCVTLIWASGHFDGFTGLEANEILSACDRLSAPEPKIPESKIPA